MSDTLPTIDLDALRERLAQTLEDVGGPASAALATDGDGTLWSSDVGEALFDHVLLERLVGDGARDALLAEADAHAVVLPDRNDPTAIAQALWNAYVARRFPEDRMCAAMAWCVAGLSLAVLDELCETILEGPFALEKRLIEESNEVVKWAARRAVPLVLVSASPRCIVECAADFVARTLDVPPFHVIAMTPNVDHEIVRPGIDGTWPYADGKRVALMEHLARDGRTAIVAMGDNAFDAAMLRSARVPIAIRPKPALLAVANEVPGLTKLLSPMP